MSVTVLLSVVIYIRNDNMGKRTTAMQNEKGCAPGEREGEGRRERGDKSSDSECGALRCGERIIQNPEYE